MHHLATGKQNPTLLLAADKACQQIWPCIAASRLMLRHFNSMCVVASADFMADAFGGGGGGDGEQAGPQFTPAVAEVDVMDEVLVAIEQATHLSMEKNGVGSDVHIECKNPDAIGMLGGRGHVSVRDECGRR